MKAVPEQHGKGETGRIALILYAGILLSVLFIVLGLGAFLLYGGNGLHTAPAGDLGRIISGAIAGSVELRPHALAETGVIILLLTPVARLLAGMAASAMLRDRLYVVMGGVVLILVLAGMLLGQYMV